MPIMFEGGLGEKLVERLAADYRFPLFLLLALGLYLTRGIVAPLWLQPLTARVLRAAAWVIVLTGSLLAFSYVFLPQYIDHIEAHIVVAATNFLQGYPLHPDWTRGEGAYGMLYGPLVYELIAASLLVSMSVAASKTLPVVAFFLSAGTMTLLGARSKTPDRWETTLTFLLLLISAGFLTFWVRSEPFLILTTAFGCLAVAFLAPKPAACALGLLAGLATAMKIHAFLYFVPLAAELLLAKESHWRTWAVLALLALGSFIVGFGAPYAFDLGHLASFERYIHLMSRHGLSGRLLLFNLAAGLMILSPYVFRLARAATAGDLLGRYGVPGLTIGAVLIVAVIGAKPGSGPHHLIPFIPAILLLCLKKPQAYLDPLPSTILLAAAILISILPLFSASRLILTMAASSGDARAEQAEAGELASAFPGPEFGPADSPFARALTSRVAAAFEGARLKYDTSAWLDLAYAGLKPDDDRTLTECAGETWILPKVGELFSLLGYAKQPLFPAEFREHFKATHHLMKSGRFYSVWTCNQ